MCEWIRTDDNQAVRKINNNSFEVVEVIMVAPLNAKGIDHFGISQQIVNIDDYSEENVLDYISSFGYDSIEEVKENYGEEASQIIAECIAETDTQEIEKTFRTENQAIRFIEKEIIRQKNFF